MNRFSARCFALHTNRKPAGVSHFWKLRIRFIFANGPLLSHMLFLFRFLDLDSLCIGTLLNYLSSTVKHAAFFSLILDAKTSYEL